MDPWLEQFEARRKEREEADRTFTVLGVDLTVKPSVAPEVALRFTSFEKRIAEFIDQSDRARTEGQPQPEAGIEDDEMLEIAESAIRTCLESSSLPAWEALRSPERDDPLGLLEIYGLARYVLGRASGLPTGGPTDSSAGPPSGSKRSAARSSSAAAALKR